MDALVIFCIGLFIIFKYSFVSETTKEVKTNDICFRDEAAFMKMVDHIFRR